MMEAIFTEDEYREALKRFLEICDTPDNTAEAEELEMLMTVMEIYEQGKLLVEKYSVAVFSFNQSFNSFSPLVIFENLGHRGIVLQ